MADLADLKPFRERMIQALMESRGLTREEAEVCYARVGARLNGATHAEAVRRHPMPKAEL